MIVFDVAPRSFPPLSASDLERLGRLLGRSAGWSGERRVSVARVGTARMRQLNRAYRGIDRATDVLSFAPASADFVAPQTGEGTYAGEIVLCPVYIKKDIAESKTPETEQLVRLIIHGVLHLAGYDHQHPRDEKRMFGLQERLVTKYFQYA